MLQTPLDTNRSVHEPRVTGVSPRPTDQRQRLKTAKHEGPGSSLSSGRVRNSVVLGHTRVVQPDEELIVGVQGPATLRLAERRRTAAASIGIDEFFTARAPPIGGHGVLPTPRSTRPRGEVSCINPVNVRGQCTAPSSAVLALTRSDTAQGMRTSPGLFALADLTEPAGRPWEVR
jgi:hypothetical protein